MNTPYVKKYDGKVLLNPITKESPYLQSKGGKSGPERVSNTRSVKLILTDLGGGLFCKSKISYSLNAFKGSYHQKRNRVKRVFGRTRNAELIFSK